TGAHFSGSCAKKAALPVTDGAARIRELEDRGADWTAGSRLRLRGDAAGCDVGVAGCAAARRRLAAIDVAGETVDQPGALLVRALEAEIARAERSDQGGQQDGGRNQDSADQDRQRADDDLTIGRTCTIPLKFV